MSEKRPDLGDYGFYADLEEGVSVAAGSETHFAEGLIANLKAEVERLKAELQQEREAGALSMAEVAWDYSGLNRPEYSPAMKDDAVSKLMQHWRLRESRQEFSEKAREKFTDIVKELKKQDE